MPSLDALYNVQGPACVLQGPETVLQEGGDEDVVKMALVAMDAFNYLDSNCNGYLSKVYP